MEIFPFHLESHVYIGMYICKYILIMQTFSHLRYLLLYVYYAEIVSYIYFCINSLQSETKMESLLDRESWACLLGDFHHKPETVEGMI